MTTRSKTKTEKAKVTTPVKIRNKLSVVLGIDIGERNMACAVLRREKNTEICSVLALDVFDTKSTNSPQVEKCGGKMVNGNDCKFQPKYETSAPDVFSCKKHSDTKKLKKIVKFKKTPLDVLANNVRVALDRFVADNEEALSQVTSVGIERQVSKNPSATTISHYVLYYFTHYFAMLTEVTERASVPVSLISARKKFTVYSGPAIAVKYKDAKKQRKHWSVQVGNYLIANPEQSKIVFTEEQKKRIAETTKKDDIFESCFLSYTVSMKKGETVNF